MRRHTTRRDRPSRWLGFTLLELLVVMAVIGIIIAFILSAALDGIRRAEERSTQALISKVEAGLLDRLDALTTTRADYNPAHTYVAALWPTAGYYSGTFLPDRVASMQTVMTNGVAQTVTDNISIPSGIPRAAVIAQFDRVKSELPDVFTIQSDTNYPFNFAATFYPGTATGYIPSPYANYLLPLGVGVVNSPSSNSFGGNPSPLPYNATTNLTTFPGSTGIFGASYAAIGGLTKQLSDKLGGSPNWYDGTDNNNNGLIDEIGESGLTAAAVGTLLANHTHKTARAEALYALLVYSTGPLGSTFSPDDFDDTQVKDTDKDGLLEFVDAWGEPLQFYRWPIFYYGVDPNSPDVQRGYLPYPGATAPRDQNPLDPNQQLMSPAWWALSNNGGTTAFTGSTPLSGGALMFQSLFHTLLDPNTNGHSGPNGTFWDRGSTYSQRRAYFSKPLILSSGPDKLAGVPRVDSQYLQALSDYASQTFSDGTLVATPLSNHPILTGSGNSGFNGVPGSSIHPGDDNYWLFIENQAAQFTPLRTNDVYQSVLTTGINPEINSSLIDVGKDDITNQNLSAPGGAIQ